MEPPVRLAAVPSAPDMMGISVESQESWFKSLMNKLAADEAEKDLRIIPAESGAGVSFHSSILSLLSLNLKRILIDSKRNHQDQEGTICIYMPDVTSANLRMFFEVLYCLRTVTADEDSDAMDVLLSLLNGHEFKSAEHSVSVAAVTQKKRDSCDPLSDDVNMICDEAMSDEEDVKHWMLEPKISLDHGGVCPGEVLTGVQSPQDLVVRGRDFLRSQAGQHCIPRARKMKVSELAESLWNHYLEHHSSVDDTYRQDVEDDVTEEPQVKKAKRASKKTKARAQKGQGKTVTCYSCASQIKMDSEMIQLVRRGLEIPKTQLALGVVYYQCMECNKDNGPSETPGVCKGCKIVYWGSHHQCPPPTQTCHRCDQVFISSVKLRFHQNEHDGLKPFQCNMCDYKSHSLYQLQYGHINRGKCPNRLKRQEMYDKCKICPEPNDPNHLEKCHNPNLKLGCEHCAYRSDSQHKLDKHKHRCHRDKGCKMPKRQCPRCPQMLGAGSQAKHDKEHHDPNLPHGCDQCEYRALLPFGIEVHKGLWHRSDRHSCVNGCGKQFTTMFYMQKHAMRYCSKSEVKNELVQEELAQGKAQKDSTRLRKQNEKVKAMRELLEKSKGEEATEDMAKAIREQYDELSNSNKLLTKKAKGASASQGRYDLIQCETCPVIISRMLMDEHQENHHNPNVPFACRHCPYRTLTKQGIRVHETKYHSTKEKYPCKNEGCPVRSSSPWYVKVHMAKHCNYMSPGAKEKAKEEEIKSGRYARDRNKSIKNRANRKVLFASFKHADPELPE